LTAPSQGQWPTRRIRFATQRSLSDERRRLLSQATRVTFLPMEAIGEQGSLDLSAVRDLEEVNSGYTQFFDGDVVVAKITPCFENGKGALVSGMLGGVGFGTTELHVLTPASDLDGRFLYFITASAPFRRLGEASMTGAAGQKRVPEEFVRDYRIPVLPLPQQRVIADYLDRETARLDALVAAKERVLGLLAEKRRALITHAVTRGLDDRAPMRDTGVEWLPRVPQHWTSSKIGRLFRQVKRLGFPDLVVLSVYRDFGVIERSSRDDNANRVPEDLDKYQLVEVSDLVINKMKAWQGSLGISAFQGITSPDYVVFRPLHREDPRFLHLLLRNQLLTTVYLSMSNGIRTGQWRLEPDRFVDLGVLLPPFDEQRAIVAYIEAESAKLDALRLATERTIALLRERRSSLIAAAVTGQTEGA
jgi:type I restriction enzyme, S subunit